MTLADRIRERLEATGKTARGASLEAGLGADAIRIILDGRSASPRIKTIAALADVLDCDVPFLMGEEDSLAGRLRARMAERGTNQHRLAKAAGLNHDYVRNILRGKSADPGAEKLAALAEALGVTPHWLLFGDNSVPAPDPTQANRERGFSPSSRPTGPGEGAALSIKSGRIRLTLDQEVSVSAAQRILAILGEDN